MSCNEWREVRLGEIIEFNPKESISKGTLAKKISMDMINPFYKFVKEYEIEEYKGGSKFRNGDTLMARITPCLENGKTAKVTILNKKEIGFGSTEFIVLRAKEGETTEDFVYYIAISPYVRDIAIKSMTGTSGRQRAQVNVIQNIQIYLPPLNEQKAIAKILSDLDEKIEINNRINKILEEIAQTIFKRWFVDFEFPNESGEPYKSSGGEMVDSELGLIPKGWMVGKLEEIIEIYDFKRIPLSSIQRKKMKKIYPYYGASGIIDYVDNYIFNGKYVLMGEDGTVVDSQGYPIVQYVYGEFWANNHTHVLKTKGVFTEEYLYILLKNTIVKHIVTGAVQPKINQENLKKLKIIIPKDYRIIELYINILKNMFAKKICLENQILNLSKLRDTLLPKLMSGEIRTNR
jgi:type I restriction enzyme S subunit